MNLSVQMSFQDKTKLLSSVQMQRRKPWVHVVEEELQGLQTILHWIKNLPINKRSVPKDILYPDLLIQDAEVIVVLESNDL